MKPVYIKFSDQEVVDNRELTPGIIADYDARADLVGIEILDPPCIPTVESHTSCTHGITLGHNCEACYLAAVIKIVNATFPSADDVIKAFNQRTFGQSSVTSVDGEPIIPTNKPSTYSIVDTGLPYQ